MTALFFFSYHTVIAGDLVSSLLTHLIVVSWKKPGARYYSVSPFVSKVVKGVSISFLLLSKTLSRASSSLFTLEKGYWQRCACKNFFLRLNSSLSTSKLFTVSIWPTVIALCLAARGPREGVHVVCFFAMFAWSQLFFFSSPCWHCPCLFVLHPFVAVGHLFDCSKAPAKIKRENAGPNIKTLDLSSLPHTCQQVMALFEIRLPTAHL